MLKAVASSAADATGVTAAAVLAANQFVVGDDGSRGVKTADTTITNPVNGALSAPIALFTGTWITGGTATTCKPAILIEPTGTTSTGWTTSGTGLGINAATGFAGRILDLQLAGATVFSVNSAGSATSGGNLTAAGASAIQWNARGILSSPAAGSVQFGTTDAASPVAQSTRIQSVVAGTADTSGVNWTFRGSLSTGSGTSGDIIFQTGATGAGSTAQNTATTALTIKGATQAVVVASGKTFQIGNAATTGLSAGVLAGQTNASIVITDSGGQAYRIPCII